MPPACLRSASLGSVISLAATLVALTATAFADVTLPAIFSDHAVLQKSAKVPVWGRATDGEKVTVSLDSAKAQTTADESGKWQVMLDLSRSGPGPYDLVVQGNNTITAADVLVGEVWLASGQSNMEWLLKNSNDAATEIAASANPIIRYFSVAKAEAAAPITGYKGKWIVSTPASSGDFGAVAYFFGRNLQNALRAPVDLVQASWGGTPSETWTSRPALDSDPELKAGAEKAEAELRSYSRRLRNYLLAYTDWQETTQRQDRTFPGVPSGGEWRRATIPGKLGEAGAIWLRQTVQVSPGQAGQPVTIRINENLRGTEQVYWNDTPVGYTSFQQTVKTRRQRSHTVPANLVKAGEAVVAIRVFNADAAITLPAPITAWNLTLTDHWEQTTEFTFPPLTESMQASLPVSPGPEPQSWQGPGHLFNAMINPLIPYAIKGVVWYQGENNIGRAYQYRTAFPLLIKDWRARWGQGDFPFYFCQLANMNGKPTVPGEGNWAELREAQSLTLSVPNTGQAVLIDLGDSSNVHPRNKADVGARLAAIALAQTYGKSVPFSGPVYQAMKIEGGKVRISFTNTNGGLAAKPLPATYSVDSATGATAPLVPNSPGSQLEGFAICGTDRKWVWADARIEGDQVVVSSPRVPAPVAVRYGWANNPTCNLYNGAGFPASPFRTDNLPITTQSARY
jgi:sialate O-acetylesterase